MGAKRAKRVAVGSAELSTRHFRYDILCISRLVCLVDRDDIFAPRDAGAGCCNLYEHADTAGDGGAHRYCLSPPVLVVIWLG